MISNFATVPVPLHDLVFLDEGEHVVVGRRDIDSYGVFPPDGAALLRALKRGGTPTDAARWYEQTYGERVDIEAFLQTLDELDFVRAHGEAAGSNGDVTGQRLGRLLFSPVAWALYALIIVTAIVVSVSDAWLRPSPHHIIFCGSLVVVELTVVFGQALLALVHEAFHVLAGRRLGLRTKLRISRRLYFVVYETVLDGLVTVPRAKRFLPILAGLLADVLCLALLTLIASVTHGPGAHPALVARIGLALAVSTLPRIAWQFYFYLETDVYHLISAAFGCNELQRTARHVVRRKLQRLIGRHTANTRDAGFDPRDLQIARWYAPVLVVGYAFSVVTLVGITAPLAWQFAGHVIDSLSGARFGGTAHKWDTVVVLLLTTMQLVIAFAIAIRDRRAQKSAKRSEGRFG